MNIISTRVIRPKDRSSVVLANVEITFDTGIKLLNMHLFKPRNEGGSNFLPHRLGLFAAFIIQPPRKCGRR